MTSIRPPSGQYLLCAESAAYSIGRAAALAARSLLELEGSTSDDSAHAGSSPSAMSKDYFRDTWVRYLDFPQKFWDKKPRSVLVMYESLKRSMCEAGYANEVGEAFRPVVPAAVVRLSYKVAFGYVFADTLDKSWKGFKKTWAPKRVLIEAGDALIWQTLASVIIPGFTINRVSKYTQAALLRHLRAAPVRARQALTVAAALACVPLIVRPIDSGVSVLMNFTYRLYFDTD